MKSENEIQRAHDILCAVALEEIPVNISAEHKRSLTAALDALCWVLGHGEDEHGCKACFGNNLEAIEREAHRLGFTLKLGRDTH
jgi:hypothetical protein